MQYKMAGNYQMYIDGEWLDGSSGESFCVCTLSFGVSKCHGAGGMAGHVTVLGGKEPAGRARCHLGSLIVLIALFFSDSVAISSGYSPTRSLRDPFLAGSELAIVVKDIGNKKTDFYVMLIVIALWNMGAAFIVGVIL